MKQFLRKINPLRIYRRHFAHKVVFLTTISLIFFAAVIGYFIFSYEIREEKNKAMLRAAQTATMVFDTVYRAMSSGNQEYLERMIEEIERGDIADRETVRAQCTGCHPEVRMIELEKEKLEEIKIVRGEKLQKEFGHKIGRQKITPVEKGVLEKGEERKVIEHLKDYRVARYVTPVIAEEDCLKCHRVKSGEVIAAVSVGISLKRADEFIQKRTNSFIVLFVVSLLVIGFLVDFLIIPKILTEPISKMAKMAQEISQGKLEQRLDTNREDEIGELAKTFNKMVEDLRQTQFQLIQAEKMQSLGRMAAGVAHELNNPLTGILGYAQLLLNEIPANDPLHNDLKVIEEAAHRCKNIVANLLQFSRQREFDFKPTNLHEIIDQSLAFWEHQMALKNIKIVREYTADLLLLNLSTSHMQQAFLNIILNAQEAMPKGGTLTVRTRLMDTQARGAGNAVEISFLDTGVGMKKEILDHLFEPFFTTKEVGKGTGLGLAIVHGIVEKHNGRIYAESEGEDKGARFAIVLPLPEERNSQK